MSLACDNLTWILIGMIIPHIQMSASKWFWEMLSMWKHIGISYGECEGVKFHCMQMFLQLTTSINYMHAIG